MHALDVKCEVRPPPYDRPALESNPYDKVLKVNMIRAHLIVMQIEELEPVLRQKASFLDADPEERMKIVYQYPNLAQFKYALSKTDQVREALNPVTLPVSLAQEAQTADEQIMDYMAELNEVAEDEATREGAPKANDVTEGDLTSIVPVFKDDVDSDEEEVRLRKHLQDDFNEAADADWSPVYSVRPLTRSQESTNGRPSMTRAPTSSTTSLTGTTMSRVILR